MGWIGCCRQQTSEYREGRLYSQTQQVNSIPFIDTSISSLYTCSIIILEVFPPILRNYKIIFSTILILCLSPFIHHLFEQSNHNNRALCHLFKVSGFPTLKLIEYGEDKQLYETLYQGDRSLSDLQQFASNTKPSTLVEMKGSIKGDGSSDKQEVPLDNRGQDKKKSSSYQWTSNLVQNITESNVKNISGGVWLIDL